jgi:hypothetical protein
MLLSSQRTSLSQVRFILTYPTNLHLSCHLSASSYLSTFILLLISATYPGVTKLENKYRGFARVKGFNTNNVFSEKSQTLIQAKDNSD